MPKKHHILMLGSVVFAFALILGTMACSSTPARRRNHRPRISSLGRGCGATQAAAATKPAEGGSLPDKLVIGYPGEPTNLTASGRWIRRERCSASDLRCPCCRTADGKVVPRLAEVGEHRPEYLAFHLRKGVKFHNGEELTLGCQVQHRAVQEPYRRSGCSLQNITGVKIVDEYTFDVTLETPDPILPNSFVGNVYMLPPKYTEEKGDEYLAANPVAPAPTSLRSRGDHVTLEANPDYWQGNRRSNCDLQVYR